MAGRMLGEAFVVISPETRAFRSQADIQLRRVMTGFNLNVRIGADTKPATDAVIAFQARTAALGEALGKLRMDVKDDKAASARVAGLQSQVFKLAQSMGALTMAADTKKLDAQILAKISQVRKLEAQMSGLQMDADSTKLALKITLLEEQAKGLEDQLNDMPVGADISVIEARFNAVHAQLALLKREASEIDLVANNVAMLRQIGVAKAELSSLQAQARDIRMGVDLDPAKLLAFEAALLGFEHAAEGLKPAVQTGDVALGALGKAITGTGTRWGFLTRNITLFGGIFNRVLPVVAASVAVWHVLADAIIEVGAVWIPATLAVGAFAVAASDAAVEVQRRMQAMHTELDATGRSIPGLTAGMEQLHAAVRPQVYQLFGDAILVMTKRSGEFAAVAKATGTVVDQLAARVTYAITGGNGMGTVMRQAVTDVSKLGDSIGNVFGIFGNFFKVIPGFATGLLTIGDDFTKILESASAAAEPVLKWVLLLHGYILYTGLATTATLAFIGGMANLAKQFVTFAQASVLSGVAALRSFGSLLVTGALKVAAWGESIVKAEGAAAKFGAALAPLAANPMFWVAAAAVALGALVVAIVRSKDAAQQFNDTMQQTITNAQLSSVATTIQDAQAVTAARLAQSTRQLNREIKTNTQVFAGRAGTLNSNGAAISRLATNSDDYRQSLTHLSQQASLVNSRVGALSKQFGGQTQALGALNAAGITSAQITDTNKDHWAQALIQVDATTKAYQAMGTQSGTLGNDLDVLGRTVTDQYQAIAKLNQAWSAFISDVTSTQGSFDTVAQGFSTLADHSGKLTLTLGKLKATYADSATAIKAQGSLASATASVATAQARLQKLQSSGSATALQLAAAHSRLTAAQDRLSAAQLNLANVQMQGKAAIDALTPAGIALNQAFTDQISNLDKLFASWRTAGLANNLFTSGVKLAIAPMLKYAAGSQEATAQLVALAQEAGYQGPISFQALTKWLGNTHDATKRLKDITNQATTQEALLTGAMQAQGAYIANTLIKDINDAILKYNHVEDAARAYGNAIARDGQQSDAARSARQNLINDIIASGRAANDTKGEIAALIAKVLGIPAKKAIQIVAEASGNGNISIVGSGWAAGQGNIRFHAARGAYIDAGTGPTADDVPAMLSKGEYVIRAASVSKYGKPMMDRLNAGMFSRGGMVPGYADGGLAGLGNMLTGVAPSAAAYTGNDAKKAVQAGVQEAINAIKKMLSSGAIVPFAESFLGKIPYVWGGTTLGPAGADCSGFTQAVYARFGISAPRTSEAQGSWVAKTGPVAGGLAFYHSPPGGPDPGHVAIVANKNTVVSQGGGMGPTMERINFLPLLWTGIPPNGFPSAAGAPGAALTSAGGVKGLMQAMAAARGWTGSQWTALDALEMSEAGYSLTAQNPHSSAYGLAQFINGPSEYFTYGGSPFTAAGQITAMLNYIAQRYGTPAAAWSFHLANGYYGKGGPVPRFASGGGYGTTAETAIAGSPADPGYRMAMMAAGGSTAAWRSRLKSAQAGEYRDYLGFRKAELASLHGARPGSYLSGHKATITGELGTLAKRQSAEEAAYDAVFHKGASKAVMAHLNSVLKAVMSTTKDKGLSYSGPGGHPGWLHGLQAQVSALEHIATGPVPAGALTGSWYGPKLSQAAFLARLKSIQSAEYRDYLGLENAFKAGLRHPAKGSWLYEHRGQLGKDLAKLKSLQSAEEAGYDNIRHHGTTLPNLQKEIGRINSEMAALKPAELSHLPGGHPGWVKGLRGQLTNLVHLLSVQPFNAPWAPKNLGPSHTAAPGVLTFDSGRGTLRPGMNLAWNGTGKPEPLTSGGGPVTVVVQNHGVIGSQAEVRNWLNREINHLARTGRLTQAVQTASR